MNEPNAESTNVPAPPGTPEHHDARFGLIWAVVLFQFKLAADGIRDVLLMPVSIGAAIVGLLAGGSEPGQYFRRLQRFGRRTDVWINLFGQYKRGPTSDKLVKPLHDSIYQEYRRNWSGDSRLEHTADAGPSSTEEPPTNAR